MKTLSNLITTAAGNLAWLREAVIAFVISFSAVSYGLEPLRDSTDDYMAMIWSDGFSKLDLNKDGVYKREEKPNRWEKLKRYDKNDDGALDLEEYKGVQLKYVDSPGKQIRNVVFKEVGGRKIYLDIYLPDDDKTDKPVVLYTHGGGWAAGSKHGAGVASFNDVHKQLLKQGFCVVSVDYRLIVKGAGLAMRDCVIDSKDALRFISAHHEALGVDPMRIYTFGDSAGGHLAQMVLLSPPDTLTGAPELAEFTYKTVAGVSWYGPCDFENPQLFNHNDREKFRDRFGPRIMGSDTGPTDKLERYREMSPVNYITKDGPPLLMIQGDKDTTIPVKQAYRMQEALKTIAAPVEFLIVKNAGHNWRSVDAPIEPSRSEIVKRTIEFLVDKK